MIYNGSKFHGKSPFSENSKSLLLAENTTMTYRGEVLTVIQFHYECQETEQYFTTDEIDEINIRILLATYRNRIHIKPKTEQR